jgi:cell division protein FtsQ
LPRIAGEGAATAAAALYALLAGYPTLARQVEIAERIGERRWTLRLAGGGAIALPAVGVADALARAPQLVAVAAQEGANEIDLRVSGRTLVRATATAQQVVGQIPDARMATGGI